MTHLATADSRPRLRARSARALPRRRRPALGGLTRHAANSAAALAHPRGAPRRLPAAASPSTGSRRSAPIRPADGLEPVLSWRSEIALGTPARARASRPATAARFVAASADLDRDRPGRLRRRVPPRPERAPRCSSPASAGASSAPSRWTPSRSSSTAAPSSGEPVTIVGPGLLLEAHARVAGTITYELATRIETGAARARAPGRRRLRRACLRRRQTGARARRRASRPGASACSQPAGRYQRGTKISRRPFSSASRIRAGDERRIDDEQPQREAAARALGEAGRLDEARVDRRAPRRRAGRARPRPSARTRAGRAWRPSRGRRRRMPATETMLTSCEPRCEPGQEGAQAPDRAEVVGGDRRLRSARARRRGTARGRRCRRC